VPLPKYIVNLNVVVMRCVGIIVGYVKSLGGAMKTLSAQSEPVEKERIRLQINQQVEEFLRRGGAIDVITDNARSAIAMVGSVGEYEEELKPSSD
jgi:hypothetical protein